MQPTKCFTKLYGEVMTHPDQRLTQSMCLVYCYLLSFHETESIDKIFPGIEHIAHALRTSEKTVRRAINELVKIGLISKARRFANSSVYQVYPLSVLSGQNDRTEEEGAPTGQNDPTEDADQSGQNDRSIRSKCPLSPVKMTDNKITDKTRREDQLKENLIATLNHGAKAGDEVESSDQIPEFTDNVIEFPRPTVEEEDNEPLDPDDSYHSYKY